MPLPYLFLCLDALKKRNSTREEEYEAFISLRAISSDPDYPYAEGAGSS
jgi:hypothetical protein